MIVQLARAEKETNLSSSQKMYPLSGIILTETEVRIMDQLVKCLSDKESSEALDMHLYTFKKHLKRINFKLKARNRTHAVLIYLQLRGRLVDFPNQ
jgi:DNA-binding CsgD family transcriptional regulator